MNQSINLMMRKNSEAQLETLEADDVLILPPLAGFGVADFNRGEQMMDAGYRATQIQAERLARLRTGSAGNPALAMARSREQRTPVIREIHVENDSKVGDAVIRRHIRQPLGEPLDMDRLQKTWARCMAWTTSSACNTG